MLCQSDLILLHKWGLDDSQSHTTVDQFDYQFVVPACVLHQSCIQPAKILIICETTNEFTIAAWTPDFHRKVINISRKKCSYKKHSIDVLWNVMMLRTIRWSRLSQLILANFSFFVHILLFWLCLCQLDLENTNILKILLELLIFFPCLFYSFRRWIPTDH